MYKYLDNLKSPADLRTLKLPQLEELAAEIRSFLIEKISVNGGHLASNLGVVEVTIALHYVFDFQTDNLLWDVGHQCYTHKIITGRKDGFDRLRKEEGVSGFPNPAESPYDKFEVGHAGTSIATALGMGFAAAAKKSNEKIVAFVGDGSIANGASFEAINNLQALKRQFLVVLNDNSMSIDVTKGAIAEIFSKMRLNQTYEELVRTTKNILEHVPLIGKTVDGALEKFKKTIRMAMPASALFESMNLAYFGPVDGHDIGSLIKLFKALKELRHPAVLHIYTKKGKGYEPADSDPAKFHSTGPFVQDGGCQNACARSFTCAFADAVVELGRKDDKIVTITAAMPEGTGLNKFRQEFPERFYDFGICESAAVDIAAGMAKSGLKPLVCIYSTFLQRSYDQIAHEVSLQNLPVIFCIDRAGAVGYDGPTHHGLMDIGFLRMLPNMIVLAAATEKEMSAALHYAAGCGKPVAIRYPRQNISTRLDEQFTALSSDFETGKCLPLTAGNAKTVIVSYGAVLNRAVEAHKILVEKGIQTDIINARFAKPIDKYIVSLAAQGKNIVTIEEHGTAAGFGSALLEAIDAGNIASTGRIKVLAAGDEYLTKAARDTQLDRMGISVEEIVKTVCEFEKKLQ